VDSQASSPGLARFKGGVLNKLWTNGLIEVVGREDFPFRKCLEDGEAER
jgi:hypothetical protein